MLNLSRSWNWIPLNGKERLEKVRKIGKMNVPVRHWPDKSTKQDTVQEKRPGLFQAERAMQNDSSK